MQENAAIFWVISIPSLYPLSRLTFLVQERLIARILTPKGLKRVASSLPILPYPKISTCNIGHSESVRYMCEIAEKSLQQNFEGNMTMSAVRTLSEVLTKNWIFCCTGH
jgi:hypothetical protein